MKKIRGGKTVKYQGKEEFIKENKKGKMLAKIRHSKSGVTLMALVVTIVILLILASIGWSTGKNAIEQSR